MKIYHYHPITKDLIGTGLADKDPMVEDNWLIPAHATEIDPPEFSTGEIPVFIDGQWSISVDNRGVEYWLPDGSKHKIDDLGVSIPDRALLEKPEPEPPTPDELMKKAELARTMAYADLITGSDKYFAEAMRKRAAGDEQGAIEAEQIGLQRVLEIKEQYPLPS